MCIGNLRLDINASKQIINDSNVYPSIRFETRNQISTYTADLGKKPRTAAIRMAAIFSENSKRVIKRPQRGFCFEIKSSAMVTTRIT